MSYCVNCGVELHPTCSVCPLCHTPVVNPKQPVDIGGELPFPKQKEAVPPVNRRELALLLTVLLASVGTCCGLLNFFLAAESLWSLYIIGAAAMLWVWLVLPLLFRRLALSLRLFLDACAVGIYVLLISLDLDGLDWFAGLALPIILLLAALLLGLGHLLREGRRSILSSITLIIGAIGVFLLGVELFVDRWLSGAWQPRWSLVTSAVCLSLVIPLIIIRRVPGLREEARRRFHL